MKSAFAGVSLLFFVVVLQVFCIRCSRIIDNPLEPLEQGKETGTVTGTLNGNQVYAVWNSFYGDAMNGMGIAAVAANLLSQGYTNIASLDDLFGEVRNSFGSLMVNLVDTNGNTTAATLCNSAGNFTFSGVAAGKYTVVALYDLDSLINPFVNVVSSMIGAGSELEDSPSGETETYNSPEENLEIPLEYIVTEVDGFEGFLAFLDSVTVAGDSTSIFDSIGIINLDMVLPYDEDSVAVALPKRTSSMSSVGLNLIGVETFSSSHNFIRISVTPARLFTLDSRAELQILSNRSRFYDAGFERFSWTVRHDVYLENRLSDIATIRRSNKKYIYATTSPAHIGQRWYGVDECFKFTKRCNYEGKLDIGNYEKWGPLDIASNVLWFVNPSGESWTTTALATVDFETGKRVTIDLEGGSYYNNTYPQDVAARGSFKGKYGYIMAYVKDDAMGYQSSFLYKISKNGGYNRKVRISKEFIDFDRHEVGKEKKIAMATDRYGNVFISAETIFSTWIRVYDKNLNFIRKITLGDIAEIIDIAVVQDFLFAASKNKIAKYRITY